MQKETKDISDNSLRDDWLQEKRMVNTPRWNVERTTLLFVTLGTLFHIIRRDPEKPEHQDVKNKDYIDKTKRYTVPFQR